MNTNLSSNETRLQEAQTLVQRYVQTIVEKDIDGWMNLWDDNCVLELPFAPKGRPNRVEGKADLSTYIQGVVKNLEVVNTAQQQIYLTQDPNLIIVEFGGEGRIPSTGRTFRAQYVWMMRTNNGRLIHMRDYWNPLAAMEARGDSAIS